MTLHNPKPSIQNPALYPLALTTLRLLLAPAVLWLAWDGTAGWPYLLCLVIAFVSDYYDGVIARRLGVDTGPLRRYDSVADTIFYIAAVVAVWWVHPAVVREQAVGIGLVAMLEVARMVVDQRKFGRQASYHMWSAKAWNLILFLALVWLMGFNRATFWVPLAVWWGVVADTEGLATSFVLPRWQHDVPTIWHAYQIRKNVG